MDNGGGADPGGSIGGVSRDHKEQDAEHERNGTAHGITSQK